MTNNLRWSLHGNQIEGLRDLSLSTPHHYQLTDVEMFDTYFNSTQYRLQIYSFCKFTDYHFVCDNIGTYSVCVCVCGSAKVQFKGVALQEYSHYYL